MMKRIVPFLLVLALVLSLGSAALAAGGNRFGGHRTAAAQGCAFADADGDGICDNRAAGGQGANGQSTNGSQGANAQGRAFVDADGDGVCDNRAAGSQGANNKGCGNGLRRRRQSKQ